MNKEEFNNKFRIYLDTLYKKPDLLDFMKLNDIGLFSFLELIENNKEFNQLMKAYNELIKLSVISSISDSKFLAKDLYGYTDDVQERELPIIELEVLREIEIDEFEQFE